MNVTEGREAEQALVTGEAFSRAILDSTPAQVAAIDRQGRIVATNEAWFRFVRENPAGNVGPLQPGIGTDLLEACRCGTTSDAGQSLAALIGILSVLQGQAERFSLECHCDTLAGRRWFSMTATPLALGSGGAVVAYFDITDLRQAQAFQDEAAGRHSTLTRERLKAWDEERRDASRELHQYLFQSLAALKLNLVVEGRRSDAAEPLRPVLDGVVEVLDKLMETTRDLSRRLYPSMLDDIGLAAAVSAHLERVTVSPQPRIVLHDEVGHERFPQSLELACFRVVEEAVDNALRHARAGEVAITLRRDGDRLDVSIRDDGVGFDLDGLLAASDRSPAGLADMRERVAERNGRFTVVSRPGAGTEIAASFALSPGP